MADAYAPVQVTVDNDIEECARGSVSDDDCPRPPGVKPKSASDRAKMPGCNHAIGSRNLVVCIDGTANQFGDKNTNVIELYNLILKEDEDNQKTWYNSGIGTYVRPSYLSLDFYKQWVFHTIDMAIAWDFKKTVLGAYRWLSDNYKTGDCIFLFGFSRGAYQVRVLSAMIEKVGLIHKGNEMQIPFAYALYADPKSGIPTEDVTNVGQPTGSTSGHTWSSKAERFKTVFSRKNVKVHFVGAWDTVSSIGVARGTSMLPGTIDGMKQVCHFRHALALDERRVKFLPEYTYGGSTEPAAPKSKKRFIEKISRYIGLFKQDTYSDKDSLETLSDTKEVWFAGTHSDIGGGNVQNIGMNRARPPLRWMVFEAGAVGLRTSLFQHELSPDEQITIVESLTGIWKILEILPIDRLAFTRKGNGQLKTTRMPHRGSARKIHPGQKVHSSLMRAENSMSKKYIPKARPVDDNISFWESLRRGQDKEIQDQWLELDLYGKIANMVKELISGEADNALEDLHRIAISGDARQNVYDTVIEELMKKPEPEAKHRLLRSAIEVLKSPQGFKKSHSAKLRPSLSDLWNGDNEDHRKTAHKFVELWTDPCLVVDVGHTDWVRSVAISSDGKRVVSGSDDKMIRMWDAETGKPVGEPLRGHTGFVCSVAISSDGKRVVSGSSDSTVRMWDAETGKPVGEPLRGHTGFVYSVAISSDGKRVVSGSLDNTVRMWDAETGKPVGEPLRGHTDWVRSVEISSDGKRVVSGSDDKMIRMWDAETGKPVGEPLRGHTGLVCSVAISSDGKRVVSGSLDNTVRMWDAETGKPVGEPLRGHTGWVRSVAISSDGKRVVSGSDDKMIRMWDAETGKPVGEPLRGHTGWVRSVAISSDGKRVVSGSDDNTVRMWDAETGKPVGEPLRGHTGSVRSVAISSDGKRVVSGSFDNTVRIWDLEHPRFKVYHD